MGATGNETDSLPEEFSSYEEAGEFWDTHDSADYEDHLVPVEVDVRLQRRRFETEVDEDVVIALENRARAQHVSAGKLANDLLRQELLTA